jgi:hypothetical protein
VGNIMSLVLQSSGGGQITIQEPATASNFTQTLPAATGTVALLQTPSFATTIGVGGATPAASGAGITFPSTQSASTDANTLDDYEEGTFTPIIAPASGSLTAYVSSGYYVKTGRSVTITMSFQITTAGTASGVANFSSLPFTSVNTNFPAGNRAGTSAWREDAATGTFYFGFLSANSTSGTVTTSTNGAIIWSTSYTYVSSFVYQSAA